MLFNLGRGYFLVAILSGFVLLLMQVAGNTKLLAIEVLLLLLIVLVIGIVITGFVIWRKVPSYDQFNNRLRNIGIIAMGSLLLILTMMFIAPIGLALVLILYPLGIAGYASFLQTHNSRQTRIKASIIGAALLPFLIVFAVILVSFMGGFAFLDFIFIDPEGMYVIPLVMSVEYLLFYYGLTLIKQGTGGQEIEDTGQDLLYTKAE